MRIETFEAADDKEELEALFARLTRNKLVSVSTAACGTDDMTYHYVTVVWEESTTKGK